jgi:hypothetical protein
LEEKAAALVQKSNMAVEIRCGDHATPSTRKGWHFNFNDKRRSLGRYCSLEGSGHGV